MKLLCKSFVKIANSWRVVTPKVISSVSSDVFFFNMVECDFRTKGNNYKDVVLSYKHGDVLTATLLWTDSHDFRHKDVFILEY